MTQRAREEGRTEGGGDLGTPTSPHARREEGSTGEQEELWGAHWRPRTLEPLFQKGVLVPK